MAGTQYTHEYLISDKRPPNIRTHSHTDAGNKMNGTRNYMFCILYYKQQDEIRWDGIRKRQTEARKKRKEKKKSILSAIDHVLLRTCWFLAYATDDDAVPLNFDYRSFGNDFDVFPFSIHTYFIYEWQPSSNRCCCCRCHFILLSFRLIILLHLNWNMFTIKKVMVVTTIESIRR